MKIKSVLRHTFNASAAFVGAAVFIPAFAVSALGFPDGSEFIRSREVIGFGAGAAATSTLFVAGYRQAFLKD